MKLISKILILTLSVILVFSSCSKETSIEIGGALAGNANASLQDVAGSCQDIAVKGDYIVDTVLKDSNYINIKINFLTPGKYLVFTDTVNGMWFRDSGFSTVTGVQTIKIKGNGKPLLPGDHAFIAILNTSACLFNVTVTGTVGVGAVYSLVSAGSTCSASSTSGIYTTGLPLSASNTITVKVDVTSIGSYSISTNTANGMKFSATGSFTATGVQDVILNGSGTPTTAGTYTMTVSSAAGNCTTDVLVNAASAASDYFPMTLNSNWTYNYAPTNTIDGDTLKIAVFNKTTTINSKTYRYFVASSEDTALYAKNGNDYYEAGYFDFYPHVYVLDSVGAIEYIFLKDNVPATTTWETPETVAKATGELGVAKAKFTIVQKDISYTVLGKTYTNVIGVKRELLFKKNGDANFSLLIDGTYYYAKGVGVIDIQLGVAPAAVSISLNKVNVF